MHGGYDDRVLAVSKYFSHCCRDVDEGEKAMLWKELEVVLRTVCETTALTLREELLTFIGFNEKHPAVLKSMKEIEASDIVETVQEVKEGEVATVDSLVNSTNSKGDTSKETNSDLVTDENDVSSVSDKVKWSVAFPAEKGSERKSIITHARIWLLHDFDVIQKWRCR